MSDASPAVLPVTGSAGVILVPLGQNSRVQFVDEDGNVLGTILSFNADGGKIVVYLGELDPNTAGQHVELEADNRVVVYRVG